MNDTCGRVIDYLRLSVTDLCNYRCRYCMPPEGICKKNHRDICSLEELVEISRAAIDCGIRKIRLTGGEPLVRQGIVDLCRQLRALPGLEALAMTTNGALLPALAQPLRDAGLDRLNLSLDTLQPEKFAQITRLGTLQDFHRGLQAAQAAGFTGTKLNVVLIGGFNTDEIGDFVALTQENDLCVRFIELMPMGPCAAWPESCFVPASTVLQAAPQLVPAGQNGVAQQYQVPGWRGSVGLISPMHHRFCGQCNRIRVLANGNLKPCLHAAAEYPLRGLPPEALRAAIAQAILQKPQQHTMDAHHASRSCRNMHEIGG